MQADERPADDPGREPPPPRRQRPSRGARMAPAEKAVVGASGFTSLWALTWLGASAVAPSAAVQGGFAVGSVMAGSGLTLLWWKLRAMRHLATEDAEPAAAEEETGDPLSAGATGTASRRDAS